MSKKPNIFCLVQTKQHYSKLLDIAKLLDKDYNITFVIYRYDILSHELEHKYKYVDVLTNHVYTRSQEVSTVKNIKTYLRDRIGSVLGNAKKALKSSYIVNSKICAPILQIYYKSQSSKRASMLKSTLYKIQNFFAENKCHILLIAEANIWHLSESFIQAAHHNGAKVVIAPYAFCTPEEPANHYFNNKLFRAQKGDEEVIDSKWFYTHQGVKMLRLPKAQILAIEECCISSKSPWVQESSSADVLIAESMAMKKHYLSLGIPEEQIKVLGDVNHDRLFEFYNSRKVNREKLCRELRLPLGKKIFLFSLFPDYIFMHGAKCEFKNYHAMLTYITNRIKDCSDANIILCLHPSLRPEDFMFLESDRVKISKRPTAQLIAIADLYVTSVSSTIKWAISMGVPVINYDVYKMRYDDYKDVPGVLNIEEQSEFEEVIKCIKNDTKYLSNLAKNLMPVKDEWGVIDGKFHERLKHLITQLIKGKKQ